VAILIAVTGISLYHGIKQKNRADGNYQYALELRKEVENLRQELVEARKQAEEQRILAEFHRLQAQENQQ
jgi:hypothetical protein